LIVTEEIKIHTLSRGPSVNNPLLEE